MRLRPPQHSPRSAGLSLVEVLVAVAMVVSSISVGAYQLVLSQQYRKKILDRATAMAAADSVAIQAALLVRQSTVKAINNDSPSIRLSLLLDTLAGLSAYPPSGARLVTATSALPLPTASVVNGSSYKAVVDRCEGKKPLRAASPAMSANAIYLCVSLHASDPGSELLWTGLDKSYPIVLEMLLKPVAYEGLRNLAIDATANLGDTSSYRLFYTASWVQKGGGSDPSAARWFAREQYVPIL